MRTFGDRHAHREWRRRFKHEMHDWGRRFQREMRPGSPWWQQRWSGPGTPGPIVPPPMPAPVFPAGMWIALPFAALLRAVVAVVAIFAVISLVTSGAVFGIPLPHGIPVWAGVIGLLVLWGLVSAPLKALRRAWCYQAAYGPRLVPPFFWFGDGIIAVGGVILMIFLIDRYVPQAHEALRQLPDVIQHAAETVKTWWTTR